MISRLLSNLKNSVILILICAEYMDLTGHMKTWAKCFMNVAPPTVNTALRSRCLVALPLYK